MGHLVELKDVIAIARHNTTMATFHDTFVAPENITIPSALIESSVILLMSAQHMFMT